MKSTELGDIISRAWEDDAFKGRLKSNPECTLEECGINLAGVSRIYIHENSEDEVHIVIPRRPADLDRIMKNSSPPSSPRGCTLKCRGDNSW